MESLFTPWRYVWVTSPQKPRGCLFCTAQKARRDGPGNWVLYRGRDNFVILNLFPYNNGHLMVVPNRHVRSLSRLRSEQLQEMMYLMQVCERSLRRLYRPQGFNLGMNLGKCSGAGIEAHLHMHLVPRWAGDTNFLSVMNGTRILPEALTSTFRKLRKAILQDLDPLAVQSATSSGKPKQKPASRRKA